jgi:hypothetical protein
MKRLLVLIGMLSALVAAYPVAAQHEDGRGDRYERRDDSRRGNDRDRNARGDERRGRDREADRPTRRESMSPDELRQLRRDIEDYGRDIYRDRRGRRN